MASVSYSPISVAGLRVVDQAASFPEVGISGPRACSCAPTASHCVCGRSAAIAVAAAFCAELAARPARPVIAVGCVSGVSAACRQAFGFSGVVAAPPAGGCVQPVPGLRVWSVGSSSRGPAFEGALGRAAFAARSQAFVSAVTAASGVFVSFMASPSCPPGVSLASPFGGSGSGTWASAAAAVAAGCASLVWLPGPAPARFPAVWGGRFSCIEPAAPGGSWWYVPAATIAAAGSLF